LQTRESSSRYLQRCATVRKSTYSGRKVARQFISV
jgi:hypothetical protein